MMLVADLALDQHAAMQDVDTQLPLAVLESMEMLQKGHSPQTFSS